MFIVNDNFVCPVEYVCDVRDTYDIEDIEDILEVPVTSLLSSHFRSKKVNL